MSAYDDALTMLNHVALREAANFDDAGIASAQVLATLAVADAIAALVDVLRATPSEPVEAPET